MGHKTPTAWRVSTAHSGKDLAGGAYTHCFQSRSGLNYFCFHLNPKAIAGRTRQAVAAFKAPNDCVR
jgi:hypothetical protein